MGVDAPLEEAPIDRLVARTNVPAAPAPAVPASQDFHETPPEFATFDAPPERRAPIAVPVAEAENLARTAAAAATTLDELRAALAAFEGCNLRLTATNLVFADGTPGSRVMFVGEAPGRDEDLQGLPFVGRAGQLFDRMLKAIGLARTDVYIANIVPWRPPGNRTPTPQETASCRPFMIRQIQLANPDFLVCLGGVSMRELFGLDGILRQRGKWRDYDTGIRTIRAMAMLHPAYLLRQPLHKRLAWRDLVELRAALDATA
jgi:DNA polymerase